MIHEDLVSVILETNASNPRGVRNQFDDSETGERRSYRNDRLAVVRSSRRPNRFKSADSSAHDVGSAEHING
jgi:hypothetical protein